MIPAKITGEVEIIPPSMRVTAIVRHSIFKTDRTIHHVAAGCSVAELLEILDWRGHRDTRGNAPYVVIDGQHVPRDLYPRVRLKPGRHVEITPVPQDKVIKSIGLVLVAVAAAVFAGPLAAAILPSLGIGAAAGSLALAVGTAAIGVGITLAGSLALNALFPAANSASALTPSTSSSGTSQSSATSPTYSIGGGRNQARQYQPIPSVLGTHRQSPAYGAAPYTEFFDNDQYLRMLFVIGYGPISVTDVRIGETPIANYGSISYEIIQDHRTNALTLYTAPVYEEQLNIGVNQDTPNAYRTTAVNVDEFSVDIVLPNGLFQYDKKSGVFNNQHISFDIYWSPAGQNLWTNSGRLNITSNLASSIRRSWRVVPGYNGTFDIHILLTDSIPVEDANYSYQTAAFFTSLRGRRNVLPINSPKALTVLALRVKATSELSGTIDTLNCICTGLGIAWNGSAWVDGQPSSNPADCFRRVLQGPANERPVADSQIDLGALQSWWTYCSTNKLTYNRVHDFSASVPNVLKDIAASGRAAVTIRDGKWSVIWDDPSRSIVQHFTPRNSRNFQSVRTFADLPHAFRVSFINAANNYLKDEQIVYADGYSAANATKFEAIDFAGVTDSKLVWRHARYHLAQLLLRRETYQLEADFEHLVCTRGDLVVAQHDVTFWGLASGRVKSVTSSPDTVTLDEQISMQSGKTYGIRFRLSNGASLLRTVTGSDVTTNTLTLATGSGLPNPGDLFSFGEQNYETARLIVQAVEPQNELSAVITMVDEAPGIASADSGTIPPFNTNIAGPVDYYNNRVLNLTANEDLQIISGTAVSLVTIAWKSPSYGIPIQYRAQYQLGSGDWIAVSSVAAPLTNFVLQDLTPGNYNFRVLAVFDNGRTSDWSAISNFNVNLVNSVPDNVTGFTVTTIGDIDILAWDDPLSAVVKDYSFRFSPATTGATWANSTPLFSGVTGNSKQVASRVGTYLAKASSYVGTLSANPAIVVTTIQAITNYNVVETVDFAGWNGTFEGTYLTGASTLRLQSAGSFLTISDFLASPDFLFLGGSVGSSGTFTLNYIKDLQAVFPVRMSILSPALGVNVKGDFLKIPNFLLVKDFLGSESSQWAVEMYYQTTNDDPSGSPTWSAWKKFTLETVNARAFRFQVNLISNASNITPELSPPKIILDMPDRTDAATDISCPVGGTTVTFLKPFLVCQTVGVTIKGLVTGDTYQISGQSASGFTIQCFDATNTSVARTFNWIAKGYGVKQ